MTFGDSLDLLAYSTGNGRGLIHSASPHKAVLFTEEMFGGRIEEIGVGGCYGYCAQRVDLSFCPEVLQLDDRGCPMRIAERRSQ